MTASLARLLVAVSLVAAPATAGSPDHDLALRGGHLYLGGDALVPGDLAVRGDRIVAVGDAPGRAAREIDATGLVIAPGFIDLHNHSDEIYRLAGWIPLPRSVHENRNFTTQGVATVVTGNCGSGPATPEDVTAWLAEVDARPFGSNVVHLVPHGQLRRDVMGESQAERRDPKPSAEELARMKALLDASLRAGGWGMSTGLEYDPGARAETEELVELNRVVARHGGFYASHTRHEGPDPERMLASYAEAIEIGERTGTRTHISHIKLSGTPVHGMTGDVMALIEAARARGVRVTADQYPYTAGSTTLAMPVPVHMRDGPRADATYCKEARRPELVAGIEQSFVETPPESILVSVYPWKWWLQGKSVAEIASDRGVAPAEVLADFACGWWGGGIYFSQSEADVRAFMQAEWVATASDGTAIPGLLGRHAHPRLYGTFPRKLKRYAVEEKVVTLTHALRSMTILPAEILGLRDRGRLAVGQYADVVAFDLATLRDVASFEHSGRESEGVRYLLVNGVLVVDEGEVTGERAGRALRPPARGAALNPEPPRS